MKSLLLIITFSVGQFLLLGQNNKEQAHEYGREAIRLMDEEKNYQEAIKLLRKAQSLDENNLLYSYEIAYAFFAQKRYKSAIGFLQKLQKKDGFNERFYRLLGACYDLNGDLKRAERTYLKGIEKHPFGGELYTEMGGLQYRSGNIDHAVNYWEMGIRRDPTFASNYYWTAKMYMHSSEQVWGVFYGELFMNLERNSKRTAEIGKMLLGTYLSGFHKESDFSGWFSLSERARTYRLLEFEEKDQLPFQVAYNDAFGKVFTKWIEADSTSKEVAGIQEMTTLRSKFVKHWFKYERYSPYPNILLDWHQKIIKEGHFEAYTYWVLMNGDIPTFEAWIKIHKQEFGAFMNWFKKNPLKLHQHKKFHRLQYIEGNQPLKDF